MCLMRARRLRLKATYLIFGEAAFRAASFVVTKSNRGAAG